MKLKHGSFLLVGAIVSSILTSLSLLRNDESSPPWSWSIDAATTTTSNTPHNVKNHPISSETKNYWIRSHMKVSDLESFLRKHERVNGWFFRGARYATLVLMRLQLMDARSSIISGAIGEIGVHHGKFTSFLAFFARQDDVERKQLFAADLFEGLQHFNIDISGSGSTTKFNEALSLANMTMNDTVMFVGPSQNITPDYFKQHGLDPFRFFSIDGGHTKETTLSDLLLIEQYVTDGAIVTLDDFLRGDWWGVSQAALEYHDRGGEHNGRLVPFAYASNKVFYTTPSHYEYYRQGLRKDPGMVEMMHDGEVIWSSVSRQPEYQDMRQAFGSSSLDWYCPRAGVGEKLLACTNDRRLDGDNPNVTSAAIQLLQYFDSATTR